MPSFSFQTGERGGISAEKNDVTIRTDDDRVGGVPVDIPNPPAQTGDVLQFQRTNGDGKWNVVPLQNVSPTNIDVDDDGVDVANNVDNLNFGTNLDVTDEGGGDVTIDSATAVLSVEDDGIEIEDAANTLNFQSLIDASVPTNGEVDVSLDSTVMTEGENLSLLNIDIDSDDLPEGNANLYFTGERVDDRVDQLLQAGTSVVSLTFDDPNDTLTIDVEEDLSAYNNDVGFISGLNAFTTDDLDEGSTNQYFTDERAQDAVASALTAGNGVTINYDDPNDTLTISASDLTLEEVQDDAWAVLTGTQTLIDVTYDDANDEVDFVVEDDLTQYDFSNVTTDEISEGSSNLYFTNERAQDAVAAALTGGSNITVTYDDPNDTLTITGTDTQLTDEEVQDAVYTNVLSGVQTLISVTYDDVNNEVDYVVNDDLSLYDNSTSGFISDLSSFTTSDLSEGSNLYFTDERAQDAVAAAAVGGTNVTINYDDAANTLTINSTQLTDEEVQDATFNNVLSGTQTLISVTYDDANNEVDYVVEDDLSLYDNSTSGFISDLSGFTTDDLTEGVSNLYFTDERAQDAAAAALVGGANITITYDDAADTITVDGTDTQLSDEEVQDSVYNNVLSGTQTLITVTYDDPNNEVDYVVEDDLSQYDNSTSGFISDLSAFTTDDLTEGTSNLYYLDSRVDSLITAGTGITTTFTQNDPANGNLTIDATLADFSTDDLSEGSSNLYFTDTRAVNAVETADPLNLQSVVINGTLTNSAGDSFLVGTAFNDDEIPFYDAANNRFEGSSDITFTDTLFDLNTDADFGGNLFVGNGIDVTGASTFSDGVTFSSTATFNGGIAGVDTDGIPEGAVNLYFTDARAVAAVEAEPTLNLQSIDVANDSTFQSNLTIQGDLTVNGSEFITETETVSISDNSIVLNEGESASGVSAGQAGIEIDRGSLEPFVFTFDEGDDEFKLGSQFTEINYSNLSGTFDFNEKIVGGTSGAEAFIFEDTGSILRLKRQTGTFTVGETITGQTSTASATVDSIAEVSDIQPSLLRNDSPTDTALFFWDAGNKVAATDSSLTFDGTTLQVPDLNVTGGISGISTDDITEGSNLFFTDERAQDAVAAALVGGSNVTVTYDDAADTLTIDGTDTRTDVSGDGTTVVSDTTDINFTTNLNVMDDGDGSVTVSAGAADLAVEDSGTPVLNSAGTINFANLLDATNPSGNIVDVDVNDDLSLYDNSTSGFISGIQIEDSGTDVVGGITNLDFGTNLTVTDNTGVEAGEVIIDATDTQLTDEEVQDAVYNNVLSGTQTLISVTYDDANNEVDYIVNDDLSLYDNSNSSFITGVTVEDSGASISTNIQTFNFGANIDVTNDGGGRVTVDGTDTRANVSDDGTQVVENTTDINFASNLSVTDDGDGSVTVAGTDTQLSTEEVQDAVYNNVLTGVQTLISVTYDDANNEVDYVVNDDLSLYDNSTSGFISDLSAFTTDDLSGGTSNLYYLDSRVNNLITGGTGVTTSFTQNDPASGTLTINSNLAPFTTDDLAEGGNLYFTDERAQDATLNVVSGSQGIVWNYDDVNNQATVTLDNLNFFSTDDLSEGPTNLYFTNTRVFEAGQVQLVGGTDIDIVEDAGNETFTFNFNGFDTQSNGTTTVADTLTLNFQSLLNVASVGGGQADVSLDSTVMVEGENVSLLNLDITTDDVPEGSTNLYFTDARAISAVENEPTLDLTGDLSVVGSIESSTGDASSGDNFSVALGDSSIASGGGAVAFGSASTSSGIESATFGDSTTASGARSFAIGNGSEAAGISSFVMGEFTTANGIASIAAGEDTIAGTDNSVSIGQFNSANQTADGTLFVIGNGADVANRSDALTVDNTGALSIGGFFSLPNGTSVNNIKTSITGTSDDALVTEGAVAAAIPDTTDELTEGSTNLYFTDERAQDAVGTITSGGTDVTVTYDDAANTITIDHDNTGAASSSNTGATVLQSLTSDGRGHVETISTKDVVGSVSGGTDITVSAATGDPVTINHADTGAASSSNTLPTMITGVSTDARGHVDTLSTGTFTGGTDITITGSSIDHADTGTDQSTGNTGGTVLQNISTDARGHVDSVSTITLDTDDVSEGSTNLYFTDTRVSNNPDVSANTAARHDQNTDTGTTSNTFGIDTTAALHVLLKNDGGDLRIRNQDDTDETNLIVENLTVNGTTTTVNSETVEIGDNILTLNSDVTGTPSENGGLAINRGTSTDASLIWDEANDVWKAGLSGSVTEIALVTESLSTFNNDLDTDNIPEGATNLYFTDERAQDAVGSITVGGTDINVTYDDAGNTLTIDHADTGAASSSNTLPTVITGATTDGRGHVETLSTGTFTGGTDITLSGGTINHANTGTDESIGNSGGTVIQNVGTDDRGHVDSVTVKTLTTDDVSEGSTNLYFTDERAQDAAAAAITGGTNVTTSYDDANDTLTISAADTQRTDEEIQDAVYANVLSGTQTLISVTYDDANDEVDYIVNDDLSLYDNSTSGFISDLSGFTTDDLTEGTSNLYYLDSRVDSLINGGVGATTTFTQNDPASGTLTIDVTLADFNTDSLSEGSSNLYFTDERAQDAAAAAITGGTNVTVTYDDPANTLTIDATDTQKTTEEVQDDVFNNVLSGTQTLISVSYDDANNEVDYVVNDDLSLYDNSTSGFISDLSAFTTDDLAEGTTNLYFTDTRAITALENAATVNFSGDITVGGTFGLSTGTTVNNIKTTIDAASDDALVTEGAIVNGGFVTGTSFTVDRTTITADSNTSATTHYSVDTSAGAVTITIRTADATDGRIIHIKRNGFNPVNINTEGTATVDDTSTTPQATIEQDNASVSLIYNSDNDDWEIF